MGGKFKPKGLHVSRKDLRKRMRKEKKEKRNNYFKNKKNIGLKLQSHNNPNNKSAKKMGKNVGVKGSLKIVPDPKNIVNQEHKNNERVEKSFIDVQNKLHKQETREKAKLERGMKNQRKKMLLEANKEEDKEIKRLEKQLKLNKRKTKAMPKSFIDEGLDWLLEVCDTDKFQASENVQFNLQESGSEFEDDFAVVTGKGKRKLKREEVSSKKLKKNSSPKDFDKSDSGSENESCSDFSHEDDESEKNQDTSEEDNEESEDISCNVIDDNTEENEENISLDSENVSGDEDVLEGSEDENVSVVSSNEDEPEISENEDENEDDSEDEGTSRDSGNEIIEEMENEKRNRLEGDGNSMNDTKSINKKKELDNGTWEDIYGRLRDKNGQILQVQEKGTYIPPHLRAKQLGQNSKKTEELARLNKQLKGLVNRLAESNLHSIANQIDELYMRNSRNDMNDSLLGLISEAVVARVLTPERLVIEHTALVAVLHANVGLEVGAHFLQRFVQRFDSLFNEAPDVEDKELDNILLIICHLYNFKVFHSVLIYNILDRLVERFTEKEVELILLVLRAVGFSLRKDDPLALKDLVLRLQKKANESDHFKDNPRVKFMLDILLAVKNNNMAKIPQYDPSHSEHLKKLMKNMIHKGKYITELKITLEDLLKAEERGRWWIVGSAWAGADKTTPSLPSALPSTDSQYSQTVLDLARKQRMNTDTRRNIFCIMVTAEDYLDAFEKLLRLGLKSQQEQEIIHVMVHCVMQEKTYNPYYSHLAAHFCRADRKHQMTIQYHIWDKLKELSKLSQSKISNLAKFLAHLFLEKALPISVLKVMQFSEMDKCQVRLLRQVLLSVLLHESVETVAAVFSRVSRSEKLHMFRESLRLFLHHFVLRNVSDLPPDQATMLRERVKLAETALVAVDNRAKLL